ncbi:MAG: hypothetical protein IKC76_04000, partial [Firmicutes bacterium]|nr:hypothetical protein [Bacillota bacterium]
INTEAKVACSIANLQQKSPAAARQGSISTAEQAILPAALYRIKDSLGYSLNLSPFRSFVNAAKKQGS